MKRIGAFLARQPLGLVALVLVVLGGSTAYAAGVRLAKNSVTSRHIKNGAVKPADLRNRAVTTKKLRNGSVTATKLANGAVLTTKIADGQVTGPKIADGSVGGGKIANGSVTTAKIADGQVTGADIANGTIGASKLDSASVGDVMSAAGTLPNTGVQATILTVPGFGVLRASCSPPNTLGFTYELNSPISQRVHEFAHDPTDNTPVGATGTTGTSGATIGYGGANHALLEGQVWSFTVERVLWIDIRTTTNCDYRVRATLDRNDAG